MDNPSFITAIRRWLGDNFITFNSPINCIACHIPISPKASHTTRCLHKGDIIICHNHLCQIFSDMASTACLNPVREKAGLLGDMPGTRPADVFIPNLWRNPMTIDFAITCPLQDRYKSSNKPVDTYVLEQKYNKYDKGFKNTEILFIAAIADTFGRWTEKGAEIITEVAHRGAKRLITNPKEYIKNCWEKLSVSIQKDCSNMLLSRIPPSQAF